MAVGRGPTCALEHDGERWTEPSVRLCLTGVVEGVMGWRDRRAMRVVADLIEKVSGGA